ncbi:MAG: DNA polymerase/3'-5' exonuclease PolX [Candidatus Pacebacteria bacterium]|nr:DNA polymerase/3'-5' exonuclease PolX [Candidatus Paceibacterota bacterium]
MTDTSNRAIAELLRQIGEYLAMQQVPFKPRAYERVAETIGSLEEEVAALYKRGGAAALKEIPGVGAGIADKIEEYLKTGKIKEYEQLKKATPVRLDELARVEGLGPKSVQKLYQKLGVRNLKELEAAAKAGKIAALEGFGKKSEEKIAKGIGFAKSSGARSILGSVMPRVHELEAALADIEGVQKVIVAGSVRRRKETIGDVDLLAISSKPKAIMDRFVSMPGIMNVIANGETKSSIKIRPGINVDLRVVPKGSYGAALNYFTGSKDHNVAIRQLAIKKGWKLNEYGLFEEGKKGRREEGAEWKKIAGASEEEIYKKLGMEYIEPELRENMGEVQAALAHKLPKIIGYGDLQGDLQVQTDWTDGSDSIETMARAAFARGLKYIAVTDHTKRLAMTHGLDEVRIKKQWAEIDAVNKKLAGKIKILKGTECDILKDGSLDLPDGILAKLDVVGVSVHSFFDMPRAAQTARVLRAMANPHVDILFHPTGRIINRRPPIDLDIDAVIAAAKRTGAIMEIDALPERSDLRDEHIRKCVDAGVRMAIDSDAHAPAHFALLEYGIAQARRGWATKEDIVNAWPVGKMEKFLKK